MGVFVSTLFSSTVASTVISLVDFSGNSFTASVLSLLCCFITIVVFAVGGWMFGIPTSESHALLASLIGAGLALNGKSAIDVLSLLKVFAGLFFSLIIGFLAGYVVYRVIKKIKMTEKQVQNGQVFWAGAAAFMHGAQDGQKFIAVFIIAKTLSAGIYSTGPVDLRQHIAELLLCSVIMAIGSAVGGKKIVDNVGSNMTKLSKKSALACSAGASVCMAAATLLGLPVSTTHSGTAAVIGSSFADDRSKIDWKVFYQMALTWVITFPVCGLLSFLLSKIAFALFL